MIVKGLKGLIGFLTIIPLGMESIEVISQYFYLCPLVSLIIGSIAGSVGYTLNYFFPHLVTGFLVLASIQILTGFHHFDGLLDFSDTIMVRGEPEKMIEVMHDKYTGAAAVAAGIIILLVSGLSLSYFPNVQILIAVLASELMAKEGMVITAFFGKIPSYEGMGYHIIVSLKQKPVKFIISFLITILIAYLLIGVKCIHILIVMSFVAFIISLYANRKIKCVTGDILGATNEIIRAFTLLILLIS